MKIPLYLVLGITAFSMNVAACASSGTGCSPGDKTRCECNGGHLVRLSPNNQLLYDALPLLIPPLYRCIVLTLDTQFVSLTNFFCERSDLLLYHHVSEMRCVSFYLRLCLANYVWMYGKNCPEHPGKLQCVDGHCNP